jgi:hypothetical protein
MQRPTEKKVKEEKTERSGRDRSCASSSSSPQQPANETNQENAGRPSFNTRSRSRERRPVIETSQNSRDRSNARNQSSTRSQSRQRVEGEETENFAALGGFIDRFMENGGSFCGSIRSKIVFSSAPVEPPNIFFMNVDPDAGTPDEPSSDENPFTDSNE